MDIRYEDYDQDQWLQIKGQQFSTMLARTGAAVHAKGKRFILGTEPDRYSLMCEFAKGPTTMPVVPYLKLYKAWETWVAEGSIDGLCAEEGCPSRLRIEGGDIKLFRQTLPERFPIYTWADTACWINRGGGPFSLLNWEPHTVEDVIRQLEFGRDTGAAGVFLHTLYHFTACDTSGQVLGGYGVLPRTEYLDALRHWNASSGV